MLHFSMRLMHACVAASITFSAAPTAARAQPTESAQSNNARNGDAAEPLTYRSKLLQFGGRIFAAGDARNNAVVGAVVQDGSNGNSFPTGVTGYGLMNSPSKQAFGLFGRCDLGEHGKVDVIGTCSNEVDAFNYAGPPSVRLPADLSFSTRERNIIGLQVVAYGDFDSSIGVSISQGTQSWDTGIYLSPQSARRFGLLVDATPSDSAQYGALIKAKSNAIPLQIQTEGSLQPDNASLVVADQEGTRRLTITQTGDILGRSWVSSADSIPQFTFCSAINARSVCEFEPGSNDGAGTMVIELTGKAIISATVVVKFFHPVGINSSACLLQPAENFHLGANSVVTGQDRDHFSFSIQDGPTIAGVLGAVVRYSINYFCPGR